MRWFGGDGVRVFQRRRAFEREGVFIGDASYLLNRGRKELNQKTLPRIRQQLLPSDNHIIVYYLNYYGLFRPFELVGFLVTLREQARHKIAAKCRRIGRELNGVMHNPRPP